MSRPSKILLTLLLLHSAFVVVLVGFLPAFSRSNAAAVQVVLLGFTNDAVKGRCVRFTITNGLGNDILYGQTIEVKARTGWKALPHTNLTQLEAQDSVTLIATLSTNDASWRVSVVYWDLHTRRSKDFLSLHKLADTLYRKDMIHGHSIWSKEINE